MVSTRTALVTAAAVTLAAATGSAAFGIVGGTTIHRAPSWMGSLQEANGDHWCGAALVSATWAVTAKHCLSERVTQARFGSADYTAGGQLVRITRSVPGPEGSDTALLQLSRPVTGSPIPLASSTPATGAGVTLLGWGQTTPVPGTSGTPRFLKQLQTRIAPGTACPGNGFDPAYDLCVAATVTQTPCNGDSGGPAAVVNGTLVGVTSRGPEETCGARGGEIYASIPAVASWIRTTIAPGARAASPESLGDTATPSTDTATPSTDAGAPGTDPADPGPQTGDLGASGTTASTGPGADSGDPQGGPTAAATPGSTGDPTDPSGSPVDG